MHRVLSLCLVLGGCSGGGQGATPPPSLAALPPAPPPPAPAPPSGSERALAAPDRHADDRQQDAARRAEALLALLRMEPGQRVLELSAGSGTFTELLARAVGPTGRVYAQNPPLALERGLEPAWTERLGQPALARVQRLDQDYATPLPPELAPVERVCWLYGVHELERFGGERRALFGQLSRVLAPGGLLLVVDFSAAPHQDARVAARLHRVDEAVVTTELLAAGFELLTRSDALRRPEDPRTTVAALPGQSEAPADAFILLARRRPR